MTRLCRHRPVSKRQGPTRTAQTIAVALCACVALAGCLPAWSQSDDSTRETIRLTPLTGEALTAESGAAGDTGPVQISILDVLTRLALLVLAVYGVAWGVNALRKSGIRIGRTATAAQNVRLRECERLALSPGVSVHVIEVDRRPVLIASGSGGEVSLLLDLQEHEAEEKLPGETPRHSVPETPTTAVTQRLSFSLRDDAEWQDRRDSLIRSLARGG